MIKAYIITIKGDTNSERGARQLEASSPNNIQTMRFDAIIPDQVDRLMKKYKLQWTYPWEGQEFNFKAGLLLSAYQTKNQKARIACFLSHYMLWERCVKYDESMIIHEHDACYYPIMRSQLPEIPPLPYEDFEKSRFEIIGLNSPKGATRKPDAYDRVVKESSGDIVRAPKIDDDNIPQGIAGNSSYYIKPAGAHCAISLAKEFGAWPNDALMCRQLIPTLGQTKTYYTYVQGLRSTTTL